MTTQWNNWKSASTNEDFVDCQEPCMDFVHRLLGVQELISALCLRSCTKQILKMCIKYWKVISGDCSASCYVLQATAVSGPSGTVKS